MPPLNCGVRRTVMEQALEIVFRYLSGAILLFFAFAPAWILFDLAKTLLLEPSDLDLIAAIAFAVCVPLLYFFLLLAYRAFTGRGRKQDGGLLPPWGLKLLAGAFGAMCLALAAVGVYRGELRMALGGLAFCGMALTLYGIGRRRTGGEDADA